MSERSRRKAALNADRLQIGLSAINQAREANQRDRSLDLQEENMRGEEAYRAAKLALDQQQVETSMAQAATAIESQRFALKQEKERAIQTTRILAIISVIDPTHQNAQANLASTLAANPLAATDPAVVRAIAPVEGAVAAAQKRDQELKDAFGFGVTYDENGVADFTATQLAVQNATSRFKQEQETWDPDDFQAYSDLVRPADGRGTAVPAYAAHKMINQSVESKRMLQRATGMGLIKKEDWTQYAVPRSSPDGSVVAPLYRVPAGDPLIGKIESVGRNSLGATNRASEQDAIAGALGKILGSEAVKNNPEAAKAVSDLLLTTTQAAERERALAGTVVPGPAASIDPAVTKELGKGQKRVNEALAQETDPETEANRKAEAFLVGP